MASDATLDTEPARSAPVVSDRRPALNMSSFVLGFLAGFFMASCVAALVMIVTFLLA